VDDTRQFSSKIQPGYGAVAGSGCLGVRIVLVWDSFHWTKTRYYVVRLWAWTAAKETTKMRC